MAVGPSGRDCPGSRGTVAAWQASAARPRNAPGWGSNCLTLYCLSSENWKRPQTELDFLMHLLEQYMIEERSTIMDNNLRLRMIGRRDGIPEDVLGELDKTVAMSERNTGTVLCLAINYGGRAELVDAMRRIGDKVQVGPTRLQRHRRGNDRRPPRHGRAPRSRPPHPHGR